MKKILLALGLVASFTSNAAWQVKAEQSEINFLSVKKEHIFETHLFDRFSGVLSSQGQLAVEVDLTSVNTMIPIRNERLQEFVFETTKFAKAEFIAQFDIASFEALSVGESKRAKITGEFNFHGQQRPLELSIVATKTSDGGFLVSTTEPFIIDTKKYGAQAGVDKLKELASLPSISYAVPVLFTVKLDPVSAQEKQ
ncbi:YceI family protein [Catenovulum sp. SM1970]|uniref:YceI family protein n=1 Tax=Marinifaba aquimaris TaxID=2741323 RepID=UPI0015741309|nr:YceI family protein [Marinifaba aquimaris]NTS76537.1 YceI family protein [Marinifaba aquimaris]